jgi:hypothetical protein
MHIDINISKHHKVVETEGVSEPVGCVIAALMFVGDVLALAPHSIACGESDGPVTMVLTSS